MVSRAKKKRQRRIDQAVGPSFQRHPLSGVPQADLKQAFVKLGKSEAERFPQLLAEMQAVVSSTSPLDLIAIAARYGMMGSVNVRGERRPFFRDGRFHQAHVEFLQALVLSANPTEILQYEPVSPEIAQQIFDGMPNLADAFVLRRYTQLQEDRSQEAASEVMIQEALRGHTQTVRNWGYYHRVLEICRSLLAPIDPLFRSISGLTGSDIIRLFAHLLERQESTATERMNRLANVVKQKSVATMVRAYYAEFPKLGGSPEDMIQVCAQKKMPLEQLKYVILSHSDLTLADDALIDAGELADALNMDPVAVKGVLAELSLGPGALQGRDPEHLFLANPVWTRPVVRLSEDQFFCGIPVTFFSFVFPTLVQLIERDANASEAYSRRRAAFLEERIEELFRSAFTGCECVRGYRWREDTTQYENDVVVRVDSHLFIVEAKSGAVSWPALRGAPSRAKTHAKELLLDPSLQSLRLQQKIEQALAEPARREELLPRLEIDLSKVRTILRLSITLDDFAVLQANQRLLRDAGWIPADHPLPAAMLVSDLELVFDLLEHTALKLHYIRRRAELQNRMRYLGDELDMLGFYLETGFNVEEEAIERQQFVLSGMSAAVDQFYMAADERLRVSKPKPRLTTWWTNLVTSLEERGFDEWSEIATVLLNFSYQEQMRAEDMFSKVREHVRKNERIGRESPVVVASPAACRSDAIALVAFGDGAVAKRKVLMRNAASRAFEESHAKRCVVIGKHIDHRDVPYTSLAAFHDAPELLPTESGVH